MTHDEEIQAAFRRDSDRLEQLRRAHPEWNIWNVPRMQGWTTWCAQPARYPLHADTADRLEEYIAENEQPPADGLASRARAGYTAGPGGGPPPSASPPPR